MKTGDIRGEAADLRFLMREIVREWGLLHAHPCVPELTLVQGHALIEIGSRGAKTIADVASRLRIDHSSASRLITKLVEKALIKKVTGASDTRERALTLSQKGKDVLGKVDEESNRRVVSALQTLTFEDKGKILEGLSLYAKALSRSRLQRGFVVRPMRKSDSQAVASVVRTVMPEYGANGAGFAFHDEELKDMWGTYSLPRHKYFVVEYDGEVVGGGGVGPLKGGDKDTCELRRMFFLPKTRGKGIGEKVLKLCLDTAREIGFKRCYLETTARMVEANGLYKKAGFSPLSKRLGATGHFSCDVWYTKELTDERSKTSTRSIRKREREGCRSLKAKL